MIINNYWKSVYLIKIQINTPFMLNSQDVNNPNCLVRVKNGDVISIKCFILQEEVVTFFLVTALL